MDNYGRAARLRTAWLRHHRACPDCQAHQPCPAGRERIKAMHADMERKHDRYSRESLPEWMMPDA